MMRSKLGLSKPVEDDALLVSQLEDLLLETETDMTIFLECSQISITSHSIILT